MLKLSQLKFLKSVVNPQELEPSIAEVAFIGRSNVGKSSVINAVCCQKGLARTSQTPGRTRAINVFTDASRDRWLVDLPGYGYASGSQKERSAWPAMIEGYLLNRPTLKMVYMIVDAKVGPTKLDHQTALWLDSNCLPFRIIANKIDKIVSNSQIARRKQTSDELGRRPEDIFWVSAEKKTGIKELAADISLRFEKQYS